MSGCLIEGQERMALITGPLNETMRRLGDAGGAPAPLRPLTGGRPETASRRHESCRGMRNASFWSKKTPGRRGKGALFPNLLALRGQSQANPGRDFGLKPIRAELFGDPSGLVRSRRAKGLARHHGQ